MSIQKTVVRLLGLIPAQPLVTFIRLVVVMARRHVMCDTGVGPGQEEEPDGAVAVTVTPQREGLWEGWSLVGFMSGLDSLGVSLII